MLRNTELVSDHKEHLEGKFIKLRCSYVDIRKHCNKCMEHKIDFCSLKLNNSLRDNFSTKYNSCDSTNSLCAKCPIACSGIRNTLILLCVGGKCFLSYWFGGPNHFWVNATCEYVKSRGAA